jgi:hypothetical protein
MKCTECNGRGHFLMLMSTPTCDVCAGTGEAPAAAIASAEFEALVIERYAAPTVDALGDSPAAPRDAAPASVGMWLSYKSEANRAQAQIEGWDTTRELSIGYEQQPMRAIGYASQPAYDNRAFMIRELVDKYGASLERLAYDTLASLWEAACAR